MKFRKFLLPVAVCATMFSLTSCGDKDVVVTLHNVGKDEALTIKATDDKKEVAKVVKALHYTSYLNKDKTVDATKAKLSLNAELAADSHKSKANAVVQYALPELKNDATMDDLVKGLKIYAGIDGEFDMPAEDFEDSPFAVLMAFSKGSAHLYTDDTKAYADFKLTTKAVEGVSASDVEMKGYLEKSLITSTILKSVPKTIGDVAEKGITNYNEYYKALKNYNLYAFASKGIETISNEESSTAAYVDLDTYLSQTNGQTVEGLVETIGLKIIDAKNGDITFGIKTDLPSGKEEKVEASLTLNAETCLPKNFDFSLYFESNPTESGVVHKSSLKINVGLEFGQDVPSLSDTKDYIINFGDFLGSFDPESESDLDY